MCADALTAGLEILKPHLKRDEERLKKGRIVVGTIEGDIHEIGKSLVALMLGISGFEVMDLGVDVSLDHFLSAHREQRSNIIAMSALMSTTMLRMRDFIQEMKDYARARDPDFIIVQQNAAALCDGHPELFRVIDAIAQEAIWYDGGADVDWGDSDGHDWVNEPWLTQYYLDYLEQYLDAGLPVFDCEYALEYASTAYINAYGEGFVPYVARRALSKLTTTPPPGY